LERKQVKRNEKSRNERETLLKLQSGRLPEMYMEFRKIKNKKPSTNFNVASLEKFKPSKGLMKSNVRLITVMALE